MAIVDLRRPQAPRKDIADISQQVLGFFLEREQVDLQKKAQAQREKEFKFEQEQAQTEAKRLEAERMAQAQGATAVLQLIGQSRPDVAQAGQGLSPGALPGFVNGALGSLESLSGIRNTDTDTRGGEIANQFDEASLDARLEAIGLGNRATEVGINATKAGISDTEAATKVKEAQVANIQVQTELGRLQRDQDPGRVAQARALWETGNMTWEQAAGTAGINPGTIPPDSFYTPLTSGSSAQGGEAARRASSFFRQMSVSNGLINSIVAETGGISFLASMQRQTGSATLDAILNQVVDPKQRQLVNAHRSFGDAYRFFVSGQQSSDREALRMLNTVAEQVNDDEGTIQQKRLMRNVMLQAAQDAAAGALDPVQAANRVLAQAEAIGMNADAMAVFREQQAEAVEYKKLLDEGGGRPFRSLSGDPVTPETLPDATARINELMDSTFTVGPGRPPGGGR